MSYPNPASSAGKQYLCSAIRLADTALLILPGSSQNLGLVTSATSQGLSAPQLPPSRVAAGEEEQEERDWSNKGCPRCWREISRPNTLTLDQVCLPGTLLCVHACSAAQSCPALCNPMDCKPTRLLCLRNFPGKNSGVVAISSSRESFPTQGSNPRLLHWQVDSLALCHLGSPGILSLPCKPHILPSCSFRVQAAGLRDTLPGSAPPPIGARALGAERKGQANVTPTPREPLGAGGRGLGRERGSGLGWLGPQVGSVPGLRGLQGREDWILGWRWE